jgi:hypothetical protein
LCFLVVFLPFLAALPLGGLLSPPPVAAAPYWPSIDVLFLPCIPFNVFRFCVLSLPRLKTQALINIPLADLKNKWYSEDDCTGKGQP